MNKFFIKLKARGVKLKIKSIEIYFLTKNFAKKDTRLFISIVFSIFLIIVGIIFGIIIICINTVTFT